jgi:hypothetical protein
MLVHIVASPARWGWPTGCRAIRADAPFLASSTISAFDFQVSRTPEFRQPENPKWRYFHCPCDNFVR